MSFLFNPGSFDSQTGIDPIQGIATALVALLLVASIWGQLRGKRSVPRARSLPFVGDTFFFLTDPVKLGETRHRQYGDIYEHKLLGFGNIIQVAEPQYVRKILASEHNLVEANFQGAMALMLGPGSLSCTKGAAHMKLRRALNPAFAPGKILDYLPTVVNICNERVDGWIEKGKFKGCIEVMALTFEVAVKVILGFDDKWVQGKNLPWFQRTVTAWQSALFSAQPLWTRFIPGSTLHKGVKAREELLRAIDNNLSHIRASKTLTPKGKEANVAHMLLDLEGGADAIDQAVLQDQCLNILFAGYETTSRALALALQKLKQNPEVLERLREEQNQVIQKFGTGFDGDVLKSLVYTEAVVKETLRFNAIVGAIFRQALCDFELGPYLIRKGQSLFLGIGRLMKEMDERWKDSQEYPLSEYHPERWLTEQSKSGGSCLPFGAGVRQCLGMNLAIAEMKVLIAILARRCEWELEDTNEPLTIFPLPCPVNDLPLKMWARDSA